MNREILFEIKALYRDNFRVSGFTFGEGEESVCIVGSMRGNENQQLYACSLLVKKMKALEADGRINPGKKILIVPCVNPYSMNIKKRFWPIDNTDINRMFPGYYLGETTQRIADGLFEAIKGYTYGMQFASFYMQGTHLPHVRVMKTGFEDIELAKQFGLPYVVAHEPRPFDTTTLNYNWQLWETKAFSIYTTNTQKIDIASAKDAVKGILNFMGKQGIIKYHGHDGYVSRVIQSEEMIPVRVQDSGFFEELVHVGDRVVKNQPLARIIDPYEGFQKSEIRSPIHGVVAYVHDEAMAYANTAVFKLIGEED